MIKRLALSYFSITQYVYLLMWKNTFIKQRIKIIVQRKILLHIKIFYTGTTGGVSFIADCDFSADNHFYFQYVSTWGKYYNVKEWVYQLFVF